MVNLKFLYSTVSTLKPGIYTNKMGCPHHVKTNGIKLKNSNSTNTHTNKGEKNKKIKKQKRLQTTNPQDLVLLKNYLPLSGVGLSEVRWFSTPSSKKEINKKTTQSTSPFILDVMLHINAKKVLKKEKNVTTVLCPYLWWV